MLEILEICTQFLSLALMNALAVIGLTMFQIYVLNRSCNMDTQTV